MLPTKFQLTDDGRQMPIDGKSSHCLWQGELKTNCSSLPNTHTCSVFRSRWSGWPYTMYRPSFLYSFYILLNLNIAEISINQVVFMSLLKHFCLSLIVPVHVCTGNYIVITCHNITVSSQVTTCTCIYNYIKVNLHVYTD